MSVTCPACGRRAAVPAGATDVACACGRRFDPTARPTVADPFLGRELRGYRVEELLGSGGMGTVYKATQLSLGRAVAFKVLPTNVADDPQFLARFHREAEVLASLAHPNIVQVIDRGEADGRFFIVMEYVEGANLRELVRRGRVPPKEACRIVAAVLAALDYAHERGVVHRDVKPENVLVRADGVVKVADFGLSRVLAGVEDRTRLTHTNLLLGTFEYMAPEQRERAGEADARADIYATAVVLYEMLTGELPIGRFALPGERVPGIDRRIDRILERGLAKDPADRFDRAGSMARAIESLLTTPGAPVDLATLRDAIGRFAQRVQAGADPSGADGDAGQAGVPPKPPVAFEMRLDLLLTVLGVSGLMLVATGVGFLVAAEDFEVGLVDLDDDGAGVIVGLFGLALWLAAERARRYGQGARSLLLALTALAASTVVALPVTVWTWTVLLGRTMRAYCDARLRGLGAPEAAALAQGVEIPPPQLAEARARRAAAAHANRRVAAILGACAFGALVAWGLVAAGGPKPFADEGAALFAIAVACGLVAAGFATLGAAVAKGEALGLNAAVWTILGPLRPKTARTARMAARDAHDALR